MKDNELTSEGKFIGFKYHNEIPCVDMEEYADEGSLSDPDSEAFQTLKQVVNDLDAEHLDKEIEVNEDKERVYFEILEFLESFINEFGGMIDARVLKNRPHGYIDVVLPGFIVNGEKKDRFEQMIAEVGVFSVAPYFEDDKIEISVNIQDIFKYK